jgi:hypothetical protein
LNHAHPSLFASIRLRINWFNLAHHQATHFSPVYTEIAQLSGQLHIAPLEPTAPGYEALSYVWHDYEWARIRSPDAFSLQVGDRDIRITRSLALALFYDPCRPCVLWVDAVCIDQSNNIERNHQVQQIYTIYSLARRVLIWLGDDGLDDSSTSVGRILTSEHGNLKIAAVCFGPGGAASGNWPRFLDKTMQDETGAVLVLQDTPRRPCCTQRVNRCLWRRGSTMDRSPRRHEELFSNRKFCVDIVNRSTVL